MQSDPALSVVLATRGGFRNIRTTCHYLQQQTIADQMELIVLAPSTDNFGMPEDTAAAFCNVKLICLERTLPISSANAEGARHASAPVIVFAEDHVFPERDWAEVLLQRHAQGYVAVGPALRNANPGTAVSWADFLVSYGPWLEGQQGRDATMLPGHNSSYKKSILLEQGDRLADCLEAESVFHSALRKSGARLFFEPGAIISHLNFACLGVLLSVQFHYGRNYAARRSINWPWWKRSIYFLASPAIPIVRLMRIRPSTIRPGPSTARVLAVLIMDLVCDGLGQAIGYIAGTGSSAEFLTNYEYDRVRFVSKSELRKFDD